MPSTSFTWRPCHSHCWGNWDLSGSLSVTIGVRLSLYTLKRRPCCEATRGLYLPWVPATILKGKGDILLFQESRTRMAQFFAWKLARRAAKMEPLGIRSGRATRPQLVTDCSIQEDPRNATRTNSDIIAQLARIPSMNSPAVNRSAIGTYREQVSIARFGRSVASTNRAKRKLFADKHFDRGSEKLDD